MPENARIFLVEDHTRFRGVIREWLKAARHTVVHEAGTLREALEQIGTLEAGQIDVAILDGNLSDDVRDGSDGETVAKAIRARFPHVKILCLSHESYKWGDKMLSKNSLVVQNGNPLGDAVNEL